MSDAMREQFEKWCKPEGLPTAIWGGMYKDSKTFEAWGAWQASRAVPIVLPSSEFIDMFVAGIRVPRNMIDKSKLEVALIAQGYMVK